MDRKDEAAKVEAIQQANKARDLKKFNDICAKAAKAPGTKLKDLDRLRAALFLSNVYREAKAKGALPPKSELEGDIFDRMKRKQGESDQFRIGRWTLPKRITEITKSVVDYYKGKGEPQRALITYLDAVAVLSALNKTDPTESQMDLLSRLSVWDKGGSASPYDPEDDRLTPALNLSNLLDRLCKKLATDNNLLELFARVRNLPCDWDPFTERLVLRRCKNMSQGASPVPAGAYSYARWTHVFPFPSIPILRVPYVVRDPYAEVVEAQNPLLDALRAISEVPVPDPLREEKKRSVKVVWYREIRLTIAPLSTREMGAVFETRGAIDARMKPTPGSSVPPEQCIDDLKLFTRWVEDEEQDEQESSAWADVRPESEPDDPKYRSINPENCGLISGPNMIERLPDWEFYFDTDPVGNPGTNEWVPPSHFSYTLATAPFVQHWLGQQHALGSEREVRMWAKSKISASAPDLAILYDRNLPNRIGFNFPDESLPGLDIEKCLHNGLIEAALQNKIDLLRQQVKEMEEVWHSGREDATNALLKRYHITQTKA